MTAAGKFGLQPSIRNHLGQAHASGALAHAEHIGIVVLTAHLRRENIGTQGSANALAFISSNGNANTSATNQDATLSTTLTTGVGLAEMITDTWLATEFAGGRHQRRVDKIMALEK